MESLQFFGGILKKIMEEGVMQSIRGRIGQYNSLAQQQQLRPYLVANERFSKEALISMFANANQVLIKPIVGLNFFSVTKKRNGYMVAFKKQGIELPDRESVYDYLQAQMQTTNYVIQPQPTSSSFYRKSFLRFITLQKRNEQWQITASTKQTNHFIEMLAYFLHKRKLQRIALLAAEQLGPAYSNCEAICIEMAFNLAGDVVITDTYLHYAISKWNQYQSLRSLMPKTDLLTDATFFTFIRKYKTVYIKPCNGQQGKGIVKIQRTIAANYEIQLGRQKWGVQDVKSVYEHIKQMDFMDQHYIIQQGIALTTIDNRFTDFRVMTQKLFNDWHVTGKVARVASVYFFITNAAQNIFPFQEALKQAAIFSLFHSQLEQRVDAICLTAAHLLDETNTRTIIGFDVGITNCGRIQIIEANYVPDLSFFRNLPDPSMYNIIMHYKSIVPSDQE